ncbi:ABC transporter permease [Glycomyces albus]
MNRTAFAYRIGLRRALIETRVSMTTPSDLAGSLIMMAVAVTVLLFMRNVDVEDSPISLGAMNLPSLIGMVIVFGGVMGIVGALVMDRTTGTLLRAKSIPGGMTGYLVGHVASQAIWHGVNALLLLVAGLILFDGLEFGSPDRWLMLLAVAVLILAATIPLGAVLGSLIDNPRNMGLVMLPMMALIAISGIFYPISALPTWLQGIGQVFPMYWAGLGMRHAMLPDSAAAVEIGQSWRTLLMFGVLALWAVAAMSVAPRLLRRMASRESGSSMEKRRKAVQQEWGG